MLASDQDLREYLRLNWLRIDPELSAEEVEQLIQPASIDLRLDRIFRIQAPTTVPNMPKEIDPAQQQAGLWYGVRVRDGGYMLLQPGQFMLAATWEIVTLYDVLAARIEGKSSLGRLGLVVHSTAGWIDPGFSGQITLEITNLANRPIRLYPGMAIAQLAVFQLQNRARAPYGADGRGSHYQGQRGPTPSRAWERFRVWDLDETRREGDR